MKCIKTEDAVGHVLCHDMTQIIPGVSKGPRFRKGHIVTAEDIPVLLSMGKEQLYVWELQPGFLHENDAAERKLAALGIRMTEHVLVEDGIESVAAAIEQMKNKPVDMILCTGGMSVDPDDSTPGAIKQSGAGIVTYGAPVLPGAMFLLGYYADGRPVMGLPGCVMYAKATIFDLVLPRIAAGVRLTRRDFVALGEGGLCLGCEVCTYPHCGFGGV